MNSPVPTAPVSPAKVAPVVQMLALDQVLADPNQPRKAFDEAALKELADSIRAEGLLQPILVKPNGKGYFIVDGERRCRAAKLAGLKEVPVLVRGDLKDQDVTAQQLVANLQREDLTLPEQCEAVAKLVKQLKSAKAVAEKLGKSEAWVSKRAGLVDAPIEVKKLLTTGVVVDAEVAAGLAELKQVAPKDKFERHLEEATQGVRYGAPFTRETIRDLVKDAKEKRRQLEAAREQAKKDRAAGKKPKPKDTWQAQQATERERREKARAQWKAGGAPIDKFARDAAKATGLTIEGPRHDDYSCEPFPSSIETCEFKWDFNGTGAEAKQVASKTGITMKLSISLREITPDQAVKIEQALGIKLKWGQEWSRGRHLTGKQLAAAASKAGAKLEVPQLSKPAPVAPAKDGAGKTAKKKH